LLEDSFASLVLVQKDLLVTLSGLLDTGSRSLWVAFGLGFLFALWFFFSFLFWEQQWRVGSNALAILKDGNFEAILLEHAVLHVGFLTKLDPPKWNQAAWLVRFKLGQLLGW